MADEDIETTAKAKLVAAITAYYSEVEPDAYVGAFVLIAHKESIELEQAGQSAVGVLEKTGQPFPMTRGLLDVALTSSRTGWSQ